MKELTKIRTDNIDHKDKRFIYKGSKKGSISELPVYFQEGKKYIPIKDLDVNEQEMIDAFVYSSGSDFEKILEETLSYDELNVFDTARVIDKLECYVTSIDKRKWARILKIGVDKWNKVRALAEFEECWQEYLIEKKAPLKRILNFSHRELRNSLTVLLDLNPGINILESVAKLLSEAAQRENISVDEYWKRQELSSILLDEEASVSEKLKNIRAKLFELRYPTIATYRNSLDRHLKSIPHASGIDIRSDENFETPGMRLQADLRSQADIEKLQEWLNEQKPHLEKIIDIQKGKDRNE